MHIKWVLFLSIFVVNLSLAQDDDLEKLKKIKGLNDLNDLSKLSDLTGDVETVVADELAEGSTQLTGESTEGKTYVNNDFADVDWSDQNLSGYAFTSVNFYNSDLSGVDFSNAVFLNTDFTDTVLDGACFYGAKFTNTDIDYGSSVKNSNFSNTTLVNSDIDGDTAGAIWKDKPCGSKQSVEKKDK